MVKVCIFLCCGKEINWWEVYCDTCSEEYDRFIEEKVNDEADRKKTEEEAREGLCVACQANPQLPDDDNYLCQECNELQLESE